MEPNLGRPVTAREADALVAAVELTVTPTLFGFLGFLLDRSLGTLPVLTVVLAGFALGYCVWRLVGGYGREMARAEAQRRPLRRMEADR